MGLSLKNVRPDAFIRRSSSTGTPWPVTWKAPQSRQARPTASRTESREFGSDPNRSITGMERDGDGGEQVGRSSGGWMYWWGTCARPACATLCTLIGWLAATSIVQRIGHRLQPNLSPPTFLTDASIRFLKSQCNRVPMSQTGLVSFGHAEASHWVCVYHSSHVGVESHLTGPENRIQLGLG